MKNLSGNVSPFLVVKLRGGWRYDEAKRGFVSSEGGNVCPYEDLPRSSKFEYMVPDLANASPKSLSEDESNLARYMHVILPKGSAASDYLTIVQSWPCVEEVRLPPKISLPR